MHELCDKWIYLLSREQITAAAWLMIVPRTANPSPGVNFLFGSMLAMMLSEISGVKSLNISVPGLSITNILPRLKPIRSFPCLATWASPTASPLFLHMPFTITASENESFIKRTIVLSIGFTQLTHSM